MELVEFLKANIKEGMSIDEIIDIFKQMCEIPTDDEDECILFETGAYDFTGENIFYFNLIRQYESKDDEYYQVFVKLCFAPDSFNTKLYDEIWSDSIDEDIYSAIKKSDSYKYSIKNKYKSISIGIEES